MRSVFLGLIVTAFILAGIPSTVQAVLVNVDGFFIADNAPEDLDPNGDIIVFDSTDTNFGFTTNTGYDAMGTVRIVNAGGSQLSLSTGQVLVLTDFVADAPTAAPPGQQFRIVFEHLFPGGPIPGGGTAADQIDAFAHDGTGEPPFQNGNNAVPLIAGEDTLDAWQGFVDNVPIPNPNGTPAFPNAAGLNTPYFVYGHSVQPLFGGLVFTPLLRGELDFTLGGTRNQFILPTSAEVGHSLILPIPEPSTLLLCSLLASLAIPFACWRRRRAA